MKTWRLMSVALIGVAGCGFPAAKVDEARAHVQRGLEVWKSGGKAEELTALTPPVEFHEAIWAAGEKMTAFELGTAEYVDTAGVVRCPVKLTVRNRKGKERVENVVYDVTLGPPVRVVFNPMP